MQISSLRKDVARLVAIYYFILAVGLPFLHRHGLLGLPPRTGHHIIHTQGSGGGDDCCPSCQWDQIAKAAPPAPLLWARSMGLVQRVPSQRAEDPFSPIFGLPASRAPPSASLGS